MLISILGGHHDKIKFLLSEMPNKQEKVPFDQIAEMRKQLGVGVMDCEIFLKKSDNVKEAIQLFHNTHKRLVLLEEEEMRAELQQKTKDKIIRLWKDTVGELPRIEYNKDKSFAWLYAEKDGEWLRKNARLLKWPCMYRLTRYNTRNYVIDGTFTGSCPQDPFVVGFKLSK